jgi:hypothetical protein
MSTSAAIAPATVSPEKTAVRPAEATVLRRCRLGVAVFRDLLAVPETISRSA